MSALDRYSLPVHCLVCGLTGTSWWTEKERPSQYTGTGRTLDLVSDGFKIVPPKDKKSDPQVHCVPCNIEAMV